MTEMIDLPRGPCPTCKGSGKDPKKRKRKCPNLACHEGQVPVESYRILRIFKGRDKHEVIKTGLTLEEAKAHCNDDSSRGRGWCDGYESENYPVVKGVRRVRQGYVEAAE